VLNKEIEALLETYEPTVIFTHHYGDVNRDHQIVFQSVLTAARPLPGKDPIEILCFETVSSSDWSEQTNDKTFKPNYYVNITDTIDDKLTELQSSDVEIKHFQNTRSYEWIEYLVRLRGMTVGFEYAEAFEMVRRVWK